LRNGRIPAPIAVGFLKPAVLVPEGFAEAVSAADLRAVAIHELAHIKRRDHVVLTLVAIVRVLLFFQPLVWIVARRVHALAEQAADEAVLEATGESLAYARLLTRLAEELPRRSRATALAAGVILSRGAFLRRVKAILANRRHQIGRGVLVTTVVASLASLSLVLAFPLGNKPPADEEHQVPGPTEQTELSKALKEGSTAERRNAAWTLAKKRPFPDAAVPALVEVLLGESKEMRRETARILAELQPEFKGAELHLVEQLLVSTLRATGATPDTAVPVLITELKSEDVHRRRCAALVLDKLDVRVDAALPVLERLARDRNEDWRWLRYKAIKALGNYASEGLAIVGLVETFHQSGFGGIKILAENELRKLGARAVSPLVALLKKGEADLRERAARALPTMGENAREAIPVLREALHDRSPNVRLAVVLALQKLGSDDGLLAPVLAGLLRESDRAIRSRAARALGSVRAGETWTMEVLLKATRDELPEIRSSAALALGELGAASAVPVLGELLKDPIPSVRANSALALGTLGPDAKAAIPSLMQLLKVPDPSVRHAACVALVKLDPQGEAFLPQLTELLHDKAIHVSAAAFRVLARLNTDAGTKESIVREVLKSTDADVRAAGVQHMGMIGEIDALPLVLTALKDEDAIVRRRATRALRAMHKERKLDANVIVPALTDALHDSDPEVSAVAFVTLGEIGHEAEVALPALLKALKDREYDIPLGDAVKLLARVGVARVSTVQLLLHSLRNENARTNQAVLALLANIRLSAQSVLPLLTAASHDSEAEVRRGVAVALAGLGQAASSAVPVLVELLRDEESWYVRREAADALGIMGPDAKAAIPALKEALRDSVGAVRSSAAAALGRIIPDSQD
jgi:HEAT repeat protein